MRKRIQKLAFYAATLLLTVAMNLARAEQSHGTVNIILANKNGLVAVTDSMLTFSNGDHVEDGNKLYEIDDRTICAMAGLYSDPGPSDLGSQQQGVVDSFFLKVPSLINYYKERLAKNKYSFAGKYASLVDIFSHDLTTHIQALDAQQPLDKLENFAIELTIAGYDVDGKLKVASVLLEPARNGRTFEYRVSALQFRPPTPDCASAGDDNLASAPPFTPGAGPLPSIRVIAKSLVCVIAGIPDVANKALVGPQKDNAPPAIATFRGKKDRGEDLTLDELRDLALFLEQETANDEQRTGRLYVGGKPNIAELSFGKISSEPRSNEEPSQVGESLHEPSVSSSLLTCDPNDPRSYQRQFNFGHSSQQGVDLVDCRVLIDNMIFNQSKFVRGAVEYDGDGRLLFSKTNQVFDTILQLGYNADPDQPDVRKLVCDFSWKIVLRNRQEPNGSLLPQRADWVLLTPACRTAWNVNHGFGLHY